MQPKEYIIVLKKDHTECIREGLAWIQAGELIKPISKIFIKPNLTFPTYQPGVMTSPQAVEAAILALREYTSHILIGDSDLGGYNRFSMDKVFMETGIAEFARKHDAKVYTRSGKRCGYRLTGSSGFIQKLARAFLGLLKNTEERQRMCQRGRQIVEQQYSPDLFVSLTLNAYQTALVKSSR